MLAVAVLSAVPLASLELEDDELVSQVLRYDLGLDARACDQGRTELHGVVANGEDF